MRFLCELFVCLRKSSLPAAGGRPVVRQELALCWIRCFGMKTDTPTIARLLLEYAQRTSLRGGNPYRAKAYVQAANSLLALSQPLIASSLKAP